MFKLLQNSSYSTALPTSLLPQLPSNGPSPEYSRNLQAPNNSLRTTQTVEHLPDI